MPFEEVYEQYFNRIYFYIRKHIQHVQDCEDLTAEIFLAAYRNWSNYDPSRCPLAAWLYLIASNRLKNFYRDRKALSSLDDEKINYNLASDDFCESAITLMDTRRLISELLKSLNERERTIVVNKYFTGWSNERIAEKLDISSGNVRVICTRALAKMRDQLAKLTGGEVE